MKIRITVYNREGKLVNAFEFTPARLKSKKFDDNTQLCFEQALHEVELGGSFDLIQIQDF